MSTNENDGEQSAGFLKAVAVWPRGRQAVWNQMVGFHASWNAGGEAGSCILRVTAADCYRVWCNGRHAGYGPARTAHGFARVDEWPLDEYLNPGENHLAVEVACNGIDSYAYVMQPAFFIAEVECDGSLISATPDGFSARLLTERVQKVERYSKQRPFAEVYRLSSGSDAWRMGQGESAPVECERVSEPRFLPRGVLLPTFDCVQPQRILCSGDVARSESPPPLRSAGRRGIGRVVRGFPEDELEVDLATALNELEFLEDHSLDEPWDGPVEVNAGGHLQVDYGIVQGGFVGAALKCGAPTRVYLMYDELRDRPHGQRFNLGLGAVALDLEPGLHHVESIEPYTFRYLRVITMDADVEVADLWVREYAYPSTDAVACPEGDSELAAIFKAARQTFRTNAIDLFTDCMSRERGGYPCDSWFTAQAERVLTGESRVERNFLENYFLVDEFSGVPAGMFPHCYPSDRLGKGQYIPNWAMWLVMELADHCFRTGDAALRDLARPGVEGLFAFFEPYFNDVGLLEDLPGWIFVEWSMANECTKAVNHPTNMLYAQCLEMAGRLYERPDWGEKAAQIRKTVRELSWDGRFFADQSVRVKGKLERTDVRTETCQYHAFSFGVADRGSYDDLWCRLRDGWGPMRGMRMGWNAGSGGWERSYIRGATPRDDDTDLVPANMLFGYMLRLELLQQAGERKRLLEELRYCFGPQAALTGSLWEHFDPQSSCNHGFASAAVKQLLYALEP